MVARTIVGLSLLLGPLALGCAAPAPRPEEFGLLILHTHTPVAIEELEFDDGRVKTSIPSGERVLVMKLPAGVYRVSAVQVMFPLIAHRFQTIRWDMSSSQELGAGPADLRVEAGGLSYPGQLIFKFVQQGESRWLWTRMLNRTSSAWRLLNERYARTAASNPFRYTGGGEDPFLERYLAPLSDEAAPDPAGAEP